MADLVATLRTGFDTVLLDAPPVLPVTDAVVTAAVADGVLLLVRWGRTRRAEVAEAVAMLERGGVPVLGGVLTRRRLTRAQRRRYSSEGPAPAWSGTRSRARRADRRTAVAAEAAPRVLHRSSSPDGTEKPDRAAW